MDINLYTFNDTEILQIKDRYKQLLFSSKQFLSLSKQYNLFDQSAKISILILSLITSFINAISGIDPTIRTYLTSSFTLCSSIIAGIVTIKKFGQESGQYFAAYGEYKELTTLLNNILTSFNSEQSYNQLNNLITQKEKKYELLLPSKKETEQYDYELLNHLDIMVNTEINKRKETDKTKKEKEEETKWLAHYNIFLERKKTIFLFESMCEYFNNYVKIQKEKNEPIISSFYQLEQLMRQKETEKYKDWVKCSSFYQTVQLSIYFKNPQKPISLDNLDQDKINLEWNHSPLLQYTDTEFNDKCKEKLYYYEQLILSEENTHEFPLVFDFYQN